MKKLLFILLSLISFQIAASYTPLSHEVEVSHNSSDVKKQHGILKLYESETKESLDFEYDFYAPTYESKNKLIVITPTIEGATPLEYLLKDYLVRNGFEVLIPYARPFDFTYGPTTTAQFERASVRARVGTLEIIRALSAQESFDENSIGFVESGAVKYNEIGGSQVRSIPMILKL